MQLLQIKHYVANSFDGKPSFVLEMSDNKTYISNGCVFAELTESNIDILIKTHNCKQYIDKLLASPSVEMKDVTDAGYMFDGCKALTAFNSDMSSVTNASCMFNGCKALTTFNSDMSSVTDANFMFNGCEALVTQ